MEAPREQAVVRYAGFWRRFLAYVLDALLLGAAFWILMLVFGTGMMVHRMGYQPAVSGVAMGGFLFMMMLYGVGGWLYFALMESSKNQATLGKMALELRVTDLTGKRIGFGKATARFFAKLLSTMTLMIGYIMAGFTQKKQALHDFVAGTLVLSKQSPVPAQVAENAFAQP